MLLSKELAAAAVRADAAANGPSAELRDAMRTTARTLELLAQEAAEQESRATLSADLRTRLRERFQTLIGRAA